MRPSLVVTAALLLVASGPAWAASNRVWVSGHGVDQAGCGAPTNPCRSLQYAHDNAAAAGGEIDILDPAGYGAITITKAISIVNDGVGTAGVQATSGNAITVSAGPSDAVYLRGLSVDGVQFEGTDGLVFNTGLQLMVVNCVFRHFGDAGVVLQPLVGAPRLTISNTLVSDNFAVGIFLQPKNGAAGLLVLDDVAAYANNDGVAVDGSLTNNLDVEVMAQRLRAEQNHTEGIVLSAPTLTNVHFATDLSYYSHNGSDGLLATGGVQGFLSRSDFSLDGDSGVTNNTSNGGQLHSYGDNRFSLDGPGGSVAGSALLNESTE